MATSVTLTTNGASTNYTLSTGARGPAGVPDPPITRTAAEGTPVGVVTPAYLGQKCIVGGPVSANRVEFSSLDGTTWTLTGPAGVIASASGYVRAAHDGTSIAYSAYSIS